MRDDWTLAGPLFRVEPKLKREDEVKGTKEKIKIKIGRKSQFMRGPSRKTDDCW